MKKRKLRQEIISSIFMLLLPIGLLTIMYFERDTPKEDVEAAASSATHYEYDAAGNLTQKIQPDGEVITYTYNGFNQMETVTDKNGTTRYVYSGDERIAKVNPDGSTHYYFGNLSELDEQGNWINHIYLDPRDPATRIATKDQNGMHYYINDHLGSPQLVLGQNGQVEQRIDYFAFGTERVNSNPAPQVPNPNPFVSPFGFTGQRKDTETGLMYYGARYYDPMIGRFTQQDPVMIEMRNRELIEAAMQHPQRLNPYSYVSNNPVNKVDPTGEYEETPLDLISLALSAYDYYRNPTLVNVIFVGLDSLGTLVPVPAVAGYLKNGTRIIKIFNYFGDLGKGAKGFAKAVGLFLQKIAFKFDRRGWAIGKKVGNDVANMVGHFVKHGDEIGAETVEQYYKMANDFIDEKQYTHIFAEGTEKVFYNRNTKQMVAVDADDNIKSFYKVDDPEKIERYNQRIEGGQ